MDNEMKSALFAVLVFAGGAVALILYQHSMHTGQIAAAVGAGAPRAATGADFTEAAATGYASLGGTPSPVNAGTGLGNNVVPISSGAGWTIN